jgi:hypothetical protein
MKTFIKISTALFFVALMAFTMQVDYQWSPFTVDFNIEFNEANADPVTEDYRKETATCWIDGREFERCAYNPGMICDASSQGSCSSTDPEVSP